MLAAKSKMSNMFLHSGQEVDFIQQKDGFRLPELWKLAVIESFFVLTKRKRLCGLDSLRLAEFRCPLVCSSIRGRLGSNRSRD